VEYEDQLDEVAIFPGKAWGQPSAIVVVAYDSLAYELLSYDIVGCLPDTGLRAEINRALDAAGYIAEDYDSTAFCVYEA
jgi:hypothetical protein